MDFNKFKSFAFGGVFSSFLTSLLYFFLSHGVIKDIQIDIKQANKILKEIHEITHPKEVIKHKK